MSASFPFSPLGPVAPFGPATLDAAPASPLSPLSPLSPFTESPLTESPLSPLGPTTSESAPVSPLSPFIESPFTPLGPRNIPHKALPASFSLKLSSESSSCRPVISTFCTSLGSVFFAIWSKGSFKLSVFSWLCTI